MGTVITAAYDQPALGAVCKIVSMEDDHESCMILSNCPTMLEKVSTPGKKQLMYEAAHENELRLAKA